MRPVENHFANEHCVINETVLLQMCSWLSKEDRLRLFNELYTVVGKRPLEKIWLETGIRKTDLYRFLPKSQSKKGGHVPSAKNTTKIAKALLRHSKTEFVVEILDKIATDLRNSYHTYFKWTKFLRSQNIINNPLSRSEKQKIESALY
jgi:uncharacterized protein (DUF2267 family)